MNFKREEITPKKAADWLHKYNNKNRAINKGLVSVLATDMRANDWHDTGETIKFNGDGTLLDGQHRLAAVVESGVTIKPIVVRGLSSDAQAVMDSGMKRSFSNVLTMQGIPSANTVAGITAAIHKIKKKKTDRRLSNSMLMHVFQKHKTGILDAAQVVLQNRPKGMPASISGALYYICRAKLKDPDNADAFIDVLVNGTPYYQDDAVQVFRDKILTLKARHISPAPRSVLWGSVLALNAFRQEIPVRSVRFPSEPTIIEGLNYRSL